MRSLPLLCALAVLAAGCLQAQPLAPSSLPAPAAVPGVPLKPMLFGAPVDTDKVSRGAEPSIAAAPDGTVWISAPSVAGISAGLLGPLGERSQSQVWRSDDGGKSFVRTGDAFGTKAPYDGDGDSDIAVDQGGRVYMADLGAGIPVIASSDKGKTWDLTKNATPGNSTDREWIVAGAAGDAWVVYENTSAEGYEYLEAVATHDGGKTWRWPATVVAQLNFPESYHGPPAYDRARGILYAPFSVRHGMAVAVSKDGGLTFDVQPAASGLSERPGFLLPSMAVDKAGNAYVAWAENNALGWQIWYSWAPPGGGTWSKPHAVTLPGGNAVMPTLVAGDAGKVAVAYYGTAGLDGNAQPDSPESSAAQWYLEVAHSNDALAPMPEFHTDVAVATPVHVGSICSKGGFCLLAAAAGQPDSVADRSLGDFFKATLLPDGDLAVAYDHDDPLPGTLADTAAVVVQSGGDRLVGS